MLRAGPLSDERVIRLANRRFIPFYFDLSDCGASGDPDGRMFVVTARQQLEQLGKRPGPVPPILFMDAEGSVRDEIGNYASSEQVLATMQTVLRDHPEYNAPSESEQTESDLITRAQIQIDLQEYDKARKLLMVTKSAKAFYLMGRLARFDHDWKEMEAQLDKVVDPDLADDVRMERAYRHWHGGDFQSLRHALGGFPSRSDRYTEARYYEGLALYHLGNQDDAMDVWKATIIGCAQDAWIYKADWAYTSLQRGTQGIFTKSGPKDSLLGRIGYLGVRNPDLKRRSTMQPSRRPSLRSPWSGS